MDNCPPLREVNAKRFFIFSVLPNALQEIPGMHFPDRMSGDDLQPLHQRLVLFRCDLQCFFLCTGPAETAKLQPFVKKKEAIPFPYESLDAVTAPSTKQKENILFIWIQLEVEFHNGCQPINASPQIRIACGNVNFPKARCVIQHGGFLLSGRVILQRLNSRFPGRGSLSGSPDPDGKRMMHLVM